MITKIKPMQILVTQMLTDYPITRDDDNLLVVKIWYRYLKSIGIDPESKSLMDFFRMVAGNQIPSSDIITRARRKVQEEHEELRGKNWEKRHNESKSVMNYI